MTEQLEKVKETIKEGVEWRKNHQPQDCPNQLLNLTTSEQQVNNLLLLCCNLLNYKKCFYTCFYYKMGFTFLRTGDAETPLHLNKFIMI